MRAKKGEKPVEVKPFNVKTSQFLELEATQHTIDYVKAHAKDDKPFFIWLCAKGIFFSLPHPDFQGKSLQGNNTGDQMMEHDYRMGQVLKAVRDAGIAENTLIVWTSDNGPMQDYIGEYGYSAFRGLKGDTLEGGVRVPSVALWPGVIEPRKDNQIVHVTDMYTTVARIAGVMDKIPTDRVVDGVDQSALLLGIGESRRNYMFHYAGANLGAVRLDWFKRHIGAGHGSLPGKEFFNIYRDPKEEHGTMAEYLWLWVPFDDLRAKHEEMIKKFPHRVLEH
jgi:arylsulfatase